MTLMIKSAANVGYVNNKVHTTKGYVTVGLKNYCDKKINESHISSSTNKKGAFRYLMESVDESSSENNIIVDGIVDFSASPHNVNKKASTCSNFQKVSTLWQLNFSLQAQQICQ